MPHHQLISIALELQFQHLPKGEKHPKLGWFKFQQFPSRGFEQVVILCDTLSNNQLAFCLRKQGCSRFANSNIDSLGRVLQPHDPPRWKLRRCKIDGRKRRNFTRSCFTLFFRDPVYSVQVNSSNIWCFFRRSSKKSDLWDTSGIPATSICFARGWTLWLPLFWKDLLI